MKFVFIKNKPRDELAVQYLHRSQRTGKSGEEHKSNSKLLTRADGRAKFGQEEKASKQRNPQTWTVMSAKKVKKRKIVLAQLRFADYLQ